MCTGQCQWCFHGPLLTLHELHEDGDPGTLLDGAVQGHHAGARHGRARRQLLGTEVFHLHLQEQGELSHSWAGASHNCPSLVAVAQQRRVNWA